MMYTRNTIYTFIPTNPVIPRSIFEINNPFPEFSKFSLLRTVTTVVSADCKAILIHCTFQGTTEEFQVSNLSHVNDM